MKFRFIPKLTAVILTLILCIGCAGSVGYAEGEDKGQSFESLDSPTDFISTDEKKEALEKSGDLPASFDLRSVDTDGDGIGDRCYVTPVRSQYPFGTCWGFSAIAAAETNILSTVLAYDPDAWKTLNLSEKQLAFFANVWLNDPDSSQYGEGIYSVNGEDYTQLAAEDIYGGGNAFLAASKVIRFKNKGVGEKIYTLSSARKGKKSFKKYFKVNPKTGKITVKKRLKKGTYKVTVKVKAAGNDNYKSVVKKVTFKIRVK